MEKGEGHGPGEPTVTIVSQPEVIHGPSAAGNCTIQFFYQVDDAKGRVTVTVKVDNGPLLSSLTAPASQLNGIARSSTFARTNDDEIWTVTVTLENHKGLLAQETTDPVQSTCPVE